MADKEIWRGLRYGEVETIIRLMGLWQYKQDIFAGIVEMERAALPILNSS